jgi:hypothetical protein
MRQPRRHFSADEKVKILRRRLDYEGGRPPKGADK